MKPRITSAEQTLQRQIEHFQRQYDDLHATQVRVTTELHVLEGVISDLTLEQANLGRLRLNKQGTNE